MAHYIGGALGGAAIGLMFRHCLVLASPEDYGILSPSPSYFSVDMHAQKIFGRLAEYRGLNEAAYRSALLYTDKLLEIEHNLDTKKVEPETSVIILASMVATKVKMEFAKLKNSTQHIKTILLLEKYYESDLHTFVTIHMKNIRRSCNQISVSRQTQRYEEHKARKYGREFDAMQEKKHAATANAASCAATSAPSAPSAATSAPSAPSAASCATLCAPRKGAAPKSTTSSPSSRYQTTTPGNPSSYPPPSFADSVTQTAKTATGTKSAAMAAYRTAKGDSAASAPIVIQV